MWAQLGAQVPLSFVYVAPSHLEEPLMWRLKRVSPVHSAYAATSW